MTLLGNEVPAPISGLTASVTLSWQSFYRPMALLCLASSGVLVIQ